MKRLATAVLVAITLCHAQGPNATPASVDRQALARIEDSLATQFLNMRKAAGLRRLARIKNSYQLRQMVCTAAAKGQFKQWGTVIYKTDDPTTPDPLFEQMVRFDAPQQKPPTVLTDGSVGTFRTGGSPKIERFAVAVWPSPLQGVYWVGVGLYWNAGWEWFDLHLTDDHYYGNLWKKNIAAECKDAR